MRHLLVWLAVSIASLSIIDAVLIWKDKRAAESGRRRISEQALLLIAVLGGWPGLWWQARRQRHKTRKVSFRIRFACAVTLHLAACIALLWWRSFI